MKKINRREFLKAGAYTALALGTPLSLAGYQGNRIVQESSGKAVTPKKTIPGSAAQANAQVAAVRGDNLYSMARDAIDALGGIQTVVKQGETVFIKPNFVSFPWAKNNNCFHNGDCTKPEIIIAIAEECLKAGAAEVIIGDGSHLPSFDWRYAITLDGRTNLVKEAKRLSAMYVGRVSLACLETDSPGWVEIPSKSSGSKIAISSLVAGADRVISIPVAKTHSWAQLTLAAKNFIGITSLDRHAQLINNTWWNRGSFDHSSPRAIARVYLDIVQRIRPDLSLIDFSIGIEGDGPTQSQGGKTVDMRERIGSWAMIASRDIMAADATAARIMNHDTQKVHQLAMGFNMGLGEIREGHIDVLGEKLDNLRAPWKPARLKNRG